MNDPISWLRPILTEEESDANGLIEAVAEARSRGLSSTIWDEQEADARRALRQVQAHRAILAEHEQLANGACNTCSEGMYSGEHQTYPCRTIKTLVSIYSDRDGYRAEWSA